jgi:hypothetical protein
MRHVIVRRSAVALTLLFVAAAGVFSWRVGSNAGTTSDGTTSTTARTTPQGSMPAATLFKDRCGACHAAEDLAVALRDGGAPRRGEFEAFLEDHADAPPEEDRLILDFLAGGR